MEYNLTKVEELFGTLQQSVVATWRKHLKTNSYSKHMALDEFYDEMPDKVDKLIEDYIGEHENLEEYINILDGKSMDALEYLETLKALCEEGRKQFLEGSSALESDMDDILGFIDGIIYKVRQLKESDKIISLKNYLVNEGNINNVERKYREFCGMCQVYNVDPQNIEVKQTPKHNWAIFVDGKKKFLVSKYILNDDIIKSKSIKLNESWDDDDEYEVVTWAKEIDPDIFDDVAWDGANEIDDFDDPDPKQVKKLFGKTNNSCILYHMDGDDADIRLLTFSKKISKSDPKIKNLMKKIKNAGYFDCAYFFPDGV